jgi:hypothetical protein
MLSWYCFQINSLVTIPVAPMITDMTKHFMMLLLLLLLLLYYYLTYILLLFYFLCVPVRILGFICSQAAALIVNPSKPKLIEIVFKNSVHTSKKKQRFSITKLNQ